MTPPRSFYLAMDARLATMAADIATMRAQLAPWIELPNAERVVVEGPQTAARLEETPTAGGASLALEPAASGRADVTAGAAAPAPGAIQSGAVPPAPVPRPPAKGATAPAGISLRKHRRSA